MSSLNFPEIMLTVALPDGSETRESALLLPCGAVMQQFGYSRARFFESPKDYEPKGEGVPTGEWGVTGGTIGFSKHAFRALVERENVPDSVRELAEL